MKNVLYIFMIFIFYHSALPQTHYQVAFTPNNMSTYYTSQGLFNQNIATNNTPGLMWPVGTNKFLVFSSGVSLIATVNNQIRMAACSYNGEYAPGGCSNGIPFTNADFKIYKVSRGDGPSNPDWANWYKMIPYGAPFKDVNNNGTFEQNIDTPGVVNANQTIFFCMTDGFVQSHTSNEGFGGGTQPLFAEVHLTSWGYQYNGLNDVVFSKYVIINKGTNTWNKAYLGIFSDADIGEANDDYMGCDSILNLGYVYNCDNEDGSGNPPTYGINPPAYGILLFKGLQYMNVNLKSTSIHPIYCTGCSIPDCYWNPNNVTSAYYRFKGKKNDGSSYLYPSSPPYITMYCYGGDPDTYSGWTQYMGSIKNCGVDTGSITPDPCMDAKLFMSSGSDNLNINPGDTQKVEFAQLVARGLNNRHSVTRLKSLANALIDFYNSGYTINIKDVTINIPTEFRLSQNYPNPFNSNTIIKVDIPKNTPVTLKVYDMLGKEITTLINLDMKAGTYNVSFDASAISSGIYLYKLTAGNYSAIKRMVLIK